MRRELPRLVTAVFCTLLFWPTQPKMVLQMAMLGLADGQMVIGQRVPRWTDDAV